ncbi:MAG: primosomal protein N' [Chloroflexota bacterium]
MRHAEVALDLGGGQAGGSFTYRVPDDMPIRPGDIVLVPLATRVLPGVVLEVLGRAPEFETRAVEDRLAEDSFIGPLQLTLARWISAHYRAPLFDCLSLFLPPGFSQRLTRAAKTGNWRAPVLAATEGPPSRPDIVPGPPLTVAQQSALRHVIGAMDAQHHQAFLLHGVTGSGKTHVYLEAIARAVQLGRQSVILVSEIAQIPQLRARVEARFPGRVAVIHGELGTAERKIAWERIRQRTADVILGARSALFAPVRRPGLVILDEEHDTAYKQMAAPRYHAREVALWWGQLAKAPVVLGSATPDVESMYRCERKRYTLLRLPSSYRPATAIGANPRAPDTPDRSAEIVDMRAELRAGNTSIFSRDLAAALQRTLAAGEQAILLLNRRGAATIVSCRDCGYVSSCRRCEIPLGYHREGERLVCHRCNRHEPLPVRCPGCAGTRIRYLGLGTQRVESEVQRLLPTARVIRWDRDTTRERGTHEEAWRRFSSGEADVLVGTQMIAKGLDVPRVTLVGVVLADVGAFLPDFRAGERAFQLITQVVGRAGRGDLRGQAIIQTYAPEHYAIRAAAAGDYEDLYRREMRFRRANGYPPVTRLVRLVYAASDAARCQRSATRLRKALQDEISRQGIADISIVGPAPCFIQRLRGRDRWQILLLGGDFARILDRVKIPPGWTIDVDPVDTL